MDKSMSILIVDDYRTMLRILRALLRQLEFDNVEEATDGTSALEKLEATSYDLIISDWHMEPMGGLELLKKVRANPRLKRTPFIMVTAENQTESVIEAKRAGVSNYIVKPLNGPTLRDRMEKALAHG
jgi:two-component system chemotaxis response regulator CheY